MKRKIIFLISVFFISFCINFRNVNAENYSVLVTSTNATCYSNGFCGSELVNFNQFYTISDFTDNYAKDARFVYITTHIIVNYDSGVTGSFTDDRWLSDYTHLGYGLYLSHTYAGEQYCTLVTDSVGYQTWKCPLFSEEEGPQKYDVVNGIGIKLDYMFLAEHSVDFYFNKWWTFEVDDVLNAIEEGNVSITDNLEDISENQSQTNQKLDEMNDFLTDETAPDSDISSLGNVSGLLPAGPLDILLNIPFQFLSILTSSMSGTCVAMTGNFVFDTTITLPCFDDIIYDNLDTTLLNFISLIPSAFILIKYFKHLYKKVERAVSLETDSDDEWGAI